MKHYITPTKRQVVDSDPDKRYHLNRMASASKPPLFKALGKIPSGLTVLTAGQGSDQSAILASWVQQVSFDPPAVTVALAKNRPIRQVIRRTNRFCLSLLAEGDSALLRKFARGVEPGQAALEGVETQITPAGNVALAGCLGWLDCELLCFCDLPGDHELVVGGVIDGGLFGEGKKPFTHVRGSGSHY